MGQDWLTAGNFAIPPPLDVGITKHRLNAGTVINVTDDTFNTEVIERSRSVPVIVDLWAEWCGPCKQLSPVLEKLAVEAGEAWVLAKVDIDFNVQLRAALQARSVPKVMAVVGGQVVDGFLGAMPEAQVRDWLGHVMQMAWQVGLAPAGGGPGGMPGMRGGHPDPASVAAREAMERGDLDGAATAFERVLAATPGQQEAVIGLAQVNLVRRVNSYNQAQARRDAAENPEDINAQARVADIDLAMGRVTEGFDRLLDAIRRTSGTERDRARMHLISLFDIFPPGEPRVSTAQATLSSLVYGQASSD